MSASSPSSSAAARSAVLPPFPRKAIGTLRGKGGRTAERAAAELEGLLADTELLDFYRASLLET